jgi:hypothetical protein
MKFFSPKYKTTKDPEGKSIYWFSTLYTPSEENEKPPYSVDGEMLRLDESCLSLSETDLFQKLPEECHNPMVSKGVFEQWISDCSGAFVKPPTIERCLSNLEVLCDSNAPVATMTMEEESDNWILQWIPTRVKVDTHRFQIYWAPSYKTRAVRIPELAEPEERRNDIDLQNPEKTYSMTPSSPNTRLITTNGVGNWMPQEVEGDSIPLMDEPALRFDTFLDSQREKYRRRIKEARIRAKLARYRAERLAIRYEERFGEYPEEDDEEAQTEAERSDED